MFFKTLIQYFNTLSDPIIAECTSALSSFLTNLNGSLNVFIYFLKHKSFLISLCQGDSSEDQHRHTVRSYMQTPSPAAANHDSICQTTSNHINLCYASSNQISQTNAAANQNGLCHSAANQSPPRPEESHPGPCCHVVSNQNNVISLTIKNTTYLVTSV